jgi:hypothetical protein
MKNEKQIDLEGGILSKIESLNQTIRLANEMYEDLELQHQLKPNLSPYVYINMQELEGLLDCLQAAGEKVQSNLDEFIDQKYHQQKDAELKVTINE